MYGVAQMQTHYSHITQADRMSIQALLQAKFSCRAIARQLNFHHSSVCREVIRGKACPTVSPANYRAGRAQARSGARRRAAGASRRKLGADVKTPLWRTVLSGLRCRWSPEQIAGKLPHMNKAVMLVNPVLPDKALGVSHETIYCAIYAMPRGTLRSELVAPCCARVTRRACHAPEAASSLEISLIDFPSRILMPPILPIKAMVITSSPLPQK